ncbi:MAG: TetR/AcrR family transcriptional regulator [Treponema sp.]|nr:TetR/AcrR family transcriptional regulator [Treponema sp.]
MNKEKWLLSLKKANDDYRQLIRESIQTALFQLMNKKEFCKIKITEVIERAGVSRSAFYRNFNSLEEVISEELKRLCKHIFEIKENNISTNWKTLLTKIDENKEVFKTLIKSGMEAKILENMNSFFKTLSLKEKTFFYSLNGIIYNFICEWCKGNLGNDLAPVIQSLDYTTRNLLPVIER